MNHLPDWLAGVPWVRWPPWSSAMPRKVSPGFSSAMKTAWLACAPECGCTLAKLAVEQLAGALDRELLGLVDLFAAAVVAPAGIALGIFVGQHRARRLEHGARDDVLRGDQLDLLLLAMQLALQHGVDRRIGLGEALGEHRQRRCRATWRRPDSCTSILQKAWQRGRHGGRLRMRCRERPSAPRAPPRCRSAADRTPRRWRRCARATAAPRSRRAPARRAPWDCGWRRSRCRCPSRRPARRARPCRWRSLAHGVAVVWIVDRSRRIGAEIEHGVTCLLQVALENFLQVEAGMIRRDRDGGPRHLDDDPSSC